MKTDEELAREYADKEFWLKVHPERNTFNLKEMGSAFVYSFLAGRLSVDKQAIWDAAR